MYYVKLGSPCHNADEQAIYIKRKSFDEKFDKKRKTERGRIPQFARNCYSLKSEQKSSYFSAKITKIIKNGKYFF